MLISLGVFAILCALGFRWLTAVRLQNAIDTAKANAGEELKRLHIIMQKDLRRNDAARNSHDQNPTSIGITFPSWDDTGAPGPVQSYSAFRVVLAKRPEAFLDEVLYYTDCGGDLTRFLPSDTFSLTGCSSLVCTTGQRPRILRRVRTYATSTSTPTLVSLDTFPADVAATQGPVAMTMCVSQNDAASPLDLTVQIKATILQASEGPVRRPLVIEREWNLTAAMDGFVYQP
jgi:hypothetical protein